MKVSYNRVKDLLFRILLKFNPLYFANKEYKRYFGKNINIKEPKTLIEKYYWLEFYSDISLWIKCSDKYGVREYITEKGGEKYLNTLYFKWDSVDQIDWSIVPSKCIIKTNNGSGKVFIIEDKNEMNKRNVSDDLKNFFSISYGYTNAQIHYTYIKPCIICEKLLESEYNIISPNSLIDYKIWCFGGKPEAVFVVYNRTNKSMNVALYDVDWNPMPEFINSNSHYIYNSDINIPRPECLDEMLEFSKMVSAPFPEVRVDMYIIKNKPIFGELTFTTGYGYFTKEYYNILGEKTDITKVHKNKHKNKLKFNI